MKHVPTQPDVLDLYLEQETIREIESWLLRFETAGSCARAYTEKRNMLRALIRWGLKEPETRGEVVKGVVRQLAGHPYVIEIMETVALERR